MKSPIDMLTKTTLLGIAAVAGLVSAGSDGACTYTDLKEGFDLYVYNDHYCYTGTHDFIYAGEPSGCYGCTNFHSGLAGDLQSFVFTTKQKYRLTLYSSTDCHGTVLGNKTGEWMDPVVSSNGQKAHSFNVCYE
ncbi:hypothetical protein BV22DRAFT_383483 [Leucogyrophana mollusca]|uniref:Uncharacterized protein n=1 Tax=Leucogyrophana mollusca TaxID=85980 RepID=A0ACB8BL23_9AGAM|nr:hypothetical protein BV22DRAFT_383483 [Leucogyrophana mollusca]